MRERRQQLVVDLLDRRDVHRRRKRVVGGLRAVDVIVGMHRLLAAERCSEQLVGAVRDHLVRVHVALRAGPGLPDDQREMVGELAVDHLLRRPLDRIGEPRVEHAQLAIDPRRRLLDDAERAHQGRRLGLAADPKVLQAALGLGAPIARGGHLDGAEGVGLDPAPSVVGRGHAAPLRGYFLRNRSKVTILSAPPASSPSSAASSAALAASSTAAGPWPMSA